MKQLFQYDPYKRYLFMGDLRCLDAFSTDEEGNLYYWQKNLFRISKLGAQIDGNKETPKDFVIPYVFEREMPRMDNSSYYATTVQRRPSPIKWHIYRDPGHKQAKTARECIRYIADRQYIEKIMYYNKEDQVAEKISSIVSVSSGGLMMGTLVEYMSSDEKHYGVIIGRDIQNHDQLIQLILNYNESRLGQSENDFNF